MCERMAAPLVGKVPPEYRQGHYGPLLVGYILYQHYQCRVPQPLIHEQLREWGASIFQPGSVATVCCARTRRPFRPNSSRLLRVGLETATYVHTDDTGARHQGHKWLLHRHRQRPTSPTFAPPSARAVRAFLETLQGESPCYRAQMSMAQQYAPIVSVGGEVLAGASAFRAKCWLKTPRNGRRFSPPSGIVQPSSGSSGGSPKRPYWEGVIEQGVDERLVILSDGATPVQCASSCLVLGACRARPASVTRATRANNGRTSEQMQQQLWSYYQQLKTYPQTPTADRKRELEQTFVPTLWSLLPAPCLAQYRC